jgi:polysaccharide biosynthesis protein PslH
MNIISLVSYPFLPARSGGEKGIALFYKYFSRHHKVTCIGVKKNQVAFAEGYEVLNILPDSPSRYFNPFIFFTIRKQIREKKATHLILEHPYYGWLGFLLKQFCGVRLVVHSHNIEGNRWKSLGKWWWRLLWNYERWTHRRADYNFFIQDEDRNYAIHSFGLDPKSCLTVPFGTEMPGPPAKESRISAGSMIRRELEISENTVLLFFNGAFRYAPNQTSLENVLFKINPLLQEKGLSYLILIAGLDIPEHIRQQDFPSVRILGFVDNLEHYLNGCQVFLNPVVSGGGIKTKLVEALSYNLNAVSTKNGAVGIDEGLCNGKLIICPDNDWSQFAKGIEQAAVISAETPPDFYEYFYWVNITKRAATLIGN